jgi:hypothetical protein
MVLRFALNTGTQNEVHDFIVFDMPKHHLQNHLPALMKEMIGREGRARRVARRFKETIAASTYPLSLGKEFSEDIQDGAYVSTAISRIVQKSSAGLRFSEAHAFRFRLCWIILMAGRLLMSFWMSIRLFPRSSRGRAWASEIAEWIKKDADSLSLEAV